MRLRVLGLLRPGAGAQPTSPDLTPAPQVRTPARVPGELQPVAPGPPLPRLGRLTTVGDLARG